MQEEQPSPETNWQFTPEAGDEQPMSHAPIAEVTWTASEFIGHDKTLGWYLILGVGAAVIAGSIFLLNHDYISPLLVICITIAAAVFSNRKPRTLTYRLSDHGVSVGDKTYPYHQFKSFSLVEEGAIKSLYLLPLQRFMPPVSVYFPPDQEDKILDTIGSYLPKEPRALDTIDRLMRQLRF